ncbi:glycosyltransferase family 4 protein [soil metagenome]
MIAPYFVPRRRVGSLRPYKFVAHLKEFGWEPVVCTIEDKSESLTDTEQQILKGIEIFKVTPPFDRTANSSGTENNGDNNELLSDLTKSLAEWFDRQVPMDTWFFLFRSSYGKILARAKDANPDIIWSTGDPWSGHWVGQKLARDLKKPWIADFRDPWTLSGLNLRKRSRFSSWADQKLEKKYVTLADKLIFTSRSTEHLYREHYRLKQEKTSTIYNSYHLSDSVGSSGMEWDRELSENLFNILFFGSFRRLSPVMPIARSVAKMEWETRRKIRIHSFGPLHKTDNKVLEKVGIRDLFVIHKKVLPEQSQSVFKKADLLLVSTSNERKTIIPAKLWDYLSSAKPILSITPNPEVGEILEKTGAGVHFSNHQEREIAEWLSASVLKKMKAKSLVNADHSEAIEQYSSRNATRQLAQIMNELASHEL